MLLSKVTYASEEGKVERKLMQAENSYEKLKFNKQNLLYYNILSTFTDYQGGKKSYLYLNVALEF